MATVVHTFAPDRIDIGEDLTQNKPALVLEPIVSFLGDHLTVGTPEFIAPTSVKMASYLV